MWYVVQTQTGEEQNLKEILMKLVPDGLIVECIIRELPVVSSTQ